MSSDSLAWLPKHLLIEKLKNNGSTTWSQHIKQMMLLKSGVQAKQSKGLNKIQREELILANYMNWHLLLKEKHPTAAVLPYLMYTTSTKARKIDGTYLFRKFNEGLRCFRNTFNPIWTLVQNENNFGKSPRELWDRFLYIYHCRINGQIEQANAPDSFCFETKRVERGKWVFSYKHMGPPCETLSLGEGACTEDLAISNDVIKLQPDMFKNTKRKANAGARVNTQYICSFAHKQPHAFHALQRTRREVTSLDLARSQTIQSLMLASIKAAKLNMAMEEARFSRLERLLPHVDSSRKSELVDQLVLLAQKKTILTTKILTYEEAETIVLGPTIRIDTQQESGAVCSTPVAKKAKPNDIDTDDLCDAPAETAQQKSTLMCEQDGVISEPAPECSDSLTSKTKENCRQEEAVSCSTSTATTTTDNSSNQKSELKFTMCLNEGKDSSSGVVTVLV